MNRKETTKRLSEILEQDKFSGASKYWAKEVTFDYGKEEMVNDTIEAKVRRIDYLQFVPEAQVSISGLEKGIFICYEIKSCKEDFLSGYGQNFVGEKNYLVMSVKTYKDLKEASLLDKLPYHIGILVAIPKSKKYKDNKIESETNAPTELDATPAKEWYLETVKPAKKKHRQRSMTELLFCMVRSSSRMLSNFKGE